MKVKRYDDVECDIEIFQPQKSKVIKKAKGNDEILYNGKCTICNSCWLSKNDQAKWYCECGGPFDGYIKVDTGEVII